MHLTADDPPPPAPEWMLTYGDLMSLLLTFFIMLVAMSDWRSEGRVLQAVEALQRRFGNDASPAGREAAPLVGPIGSRPWLRPSGPGRTTSLGGSVLFAEDSAELSPTERQQLRALAERLQGKGQRIEIRGHTTRRPLPPGGVYADHWELAFARCREVQRLLIEAGIAPHRLRLSVAGGNEPAYQGDDPLGNRENSRVEAFLLDEFAGPNEGRENPPTPAPNVN
jgi:chemotaxis protein MotB